MKIEKTMPKSTEIAFVKEFLEISTRRYIFGHNQYSKSIISTLYAMGLGIEGIIDDFSKDRSYSFRDINIPILKSEALKDLRDIKVVVVVVTSQTNTALEKLKNLGGIYVSEKDSSANIEFIDYFAFRRIAKSFDIELLELEFFDSFIASMNDKDVSTWEDFRVHFRDNRPKYEEIYNNLADEVSKEEFLKVINFRLNSDFSFMRDFRFRPKEQYFESFVNVEHIKVFFDIGAYQGESSEWFIERNKDYRQIYFFEIEEHNFALASKNLAKYKNIKGFNIALGEDRGRFGVSSDTTSSHLVQCDNGGGILSDSLDNLIANNEIMLNGGGLHSREIMLKLDIESSERFAIKGAEKFIKAYKPLIALCVYHRFDEFILLPKLILELNNEYKMYFRHYSCGLTESVMYFIPKY